MANVPVFTVQLKNTLGLYSLYSLKWDSQYSHMIAVTWHFSTEVSVAYSIAHFYFG